MFYVCKTKCDLFVFRSIDKDRNKWNENALNKIKETLAKKINGNVAKNIILFLGDGMGKIKCLIASVVGHGPVKLDRADPFEFKSSNSS